MKKQENFPDLCETFKELAAWTSNKLSKADRLKMVFNEETITESLLLKLAERHACRDLSIRAYTKPEEGTGTKKTGGKAIGADWSFWFGNTTGQGVEVRIQAKRMFTKSGKYDSLDGTGSQIQTLLNNAGSSIPLYVFYNPPVLDGHQWMPHMKRHWLTCALDWPWWGNLSDWGCSYAPVTAIPQQKKPKPIDIKWMRPWHCLVCGCCLKNGISLSLPKRVAGALENAYKQAENGGQSFEGFSQISFKLTGTPDWVNFLKNDSFSGNDQEETGNANLNKYLNQHGLDGVAAIVEIEEPR